MSYDKSLDAKIRTFRARKAREIPQLKESVDQLIRELDTPQFGHQFHASAWMGERRNGRHLKSRFSGMYYAI